ncbi:MAG: apolipoprotein N-acyltransferase [Beijerinckiaceae bacterium]
MQLIAQKILLLSGWRRLGIAMFAGLLTALTLSPLNFLPTLLVAFPVAIWLIDGTPSGQKRVAWQPVRSAFGAGWAFGFGYFVTGFWWLGAAFLVETDEFIWAMPLGVIGFPAALALFHGLGFGIARLLWSSGSRRLFAFAAAMTSVEWLRGLVLTGFPWNTIGQAFGGNDVTAQSASVFGLYGLTLLALLIFSAPALIATGETARQRWTMPIVALVLLAGMASFGIWRLQTTRIDMLADVKIRIMQPNLSQREKHRLSGQEVLTRYLALSDKATTPGTSGVSDVTHLVWPESSFPFLLAREPQALSQISGLLSPRTTLITGAARSEDASGDARKNRFFNSIHVVGPDGVIADSYDKVQLVPFGEYLPFKDLFAAIGIRQFVEIPGGFEPGARRKPLTVKGLPQALPLICYEAIFPGAIQYGNQRPGVLLNVTNDGWFGITSGPHQHLAQARMRSIEHGLPQIRAANTGISAIIDPLGRIMKSLPLGTEGIIDGQMPKVVKTTLYGLWGDFFAMILLLCSYALCIRAK